MLGRARSDSGPQFFACYFCLQDAHFPTGFLQKGQTEQKAADAARYVCKYVDHAVVVAGEQLIDVATDKMRGVCMTIPGNPPAPTDLVHHVGIAVGDLQASIDFYRNLFGLEAGPIIVRDDLGVRG